MRDAYLYEVQINIRYDDEMVIIMFFDITLSWAISHIANNLTQKRRKASKNDTNCDKGNRDKLSKYYVKCFSPEIVF